MEWLPYVHDALSYIEDNLLTVENPKEVADHLNMSEPYLQKGFQILTGYSIGEYIRNRRLYEAAVEIMDTDIKIVDAAMKYGYDSQEGFVKAFVRFHGINPSVMRKDGYTGYRKFLPITIDLLVKGGGKTDVKVVKKFGFKVIGFEKEIPEENALESIQDFWDEIYSEYFIENDGNNNIGNTGINIGDCKQAAAENGVGEYGIVLRKTKTGFLYMIAGRYTGGEVPAGMRTEEIPASEWAVFDNIGPITEGMMSIEAQDAKNWINNTTDYESQSYMNIEWYESIDRNKHHKEYRSALWIPVTCKVKSDIGEKKSGIRKFYKWKRFAVSFICISLVIALGFLVRSIIRNNKKMDGSDVNNAYTDSADHESISVSQEPVLSDILISGLDGAYVENDNIKINNSDNNGMNDEEKGISGMVEFYGKTDISNLSLKDTDDDIKASMKEFLEQFTTVHLLDSFTQSDNSAVAEFAAQYLVKKNETDIIKDDTAHVYRIPNELFDSFIDEKFYLEQEPVIKLVRQKKSQQTLLDIYFIPPMTCPLVIDWVKTDGNGKYYISGRNVYKDKRVEELKYITNSKELLDGPERYPLLDFSAIVIDTGEDGTHNWKLYEWIVSHDIKE